MARRPQTQTGIDVSDADDLAREVSDTANLLLNLDGYWTRIAGSRSPHLEQVERYLYAARCRLLELTGDLIGED